MNTTPRLLDVVALLTDLPSHGLRRGQVGTVVEMLGGAWEARAERRHSGAPRQPRPRHVCAHQGAERDVHRSGALPCARGRAQRLLRLAEAAAVEPRPSEHPLAAPDSRVVRRQPGHLRGATCVPRSARGRRDLQQAPRHAADARASAARTARLSHAALVGRQARRLDSQPAAAPIHGEPTESGLGHPEAR